MKGGDQALGLEKNGGLRGKRLRRKKNRKRSLLAWRTPEKVAGKKDMKVPGMQEQAKGKTKN